MNLYDQLHSLIKEANKLSPEELGELYLLRAELEDWLNHRGKMGVLAMGMMATHAAIKEEERAAVQVQ